MEQNFNENTETQTAAPSSGEKLYPLDWQTTEVRLAKGRFVHTVERPSKDLILERETEMSAVEVPISKSGDYEVPDVQEDLDAKYYDRLNPNATGYGERAVPNAHKSAVFQGLHKREIYVDESSDIFGDEITVIEEIGDGDEPEFVIRHVISQPDEKTLKRMKAVFKNTKILPDKRGRKKFVMKSNLPQAMICYAGSLARIEGATVSGEKFSVERRESFIAAVNPLIQRAVIGAVVEALAENLLD